MKASSGKNLEFTITCWLVVLSSGGFLMAQQSEEPVALPDKATLTRTYVQHYLSGMRINSTTVHAAMQMVADNGDWKIVLEELESGRCGSEVHCIKVLGMMTEKEAQWRRLVELHYRGEYRSAMMMGPRRPYVPTELVPILLRRAGRDKENLRQYVIALAQSRDERAREFFIRILQNASGDMKVEGAAFHAAVGLANLHEPAGIEWLIEHSEVNNKSVNDAWPTGTPGRLMDVACDQALVRLSGRYSNGECTCSRGVEYWRKWWEDAGKQVREGAYIPLVYWQQ